MNVKELMHKATVMDKDMSVSDAAKLMSEKNIGSVLVKKDGCIMIITERDILTKVVALGKDIDKTKVSDVMNKCAHIIDSDSDVFEASNLFNKHNIRRLPVAEKGEIIGMVTARDVAKSLIYLSLKADIHKRATYTRTEYR
ncbi:MAG: CBS domain-containing protein [Candidatus Altiarchaeota archaeon]|nr:CBS domain-containing protein [Candidatus Altiarchaeota archaeon]